MRSDKHFAQSIQHFKIAFPNVLRPFQVRIDVGGGPPQRIINRTSVEIGESLIRQRKPPLAVLGKYEISVEIDNPSVEFALFGDFLFRAPARGALFDILHCAPHRRRQPAQIGFQYVVGGAALERLDRAFLADGAGNEYERRVGPQFPGDVERRQAVERGQRKIGQDHVRLEFVERAHERFFRLHPLRDTVDAAAPQLPRFEFGVGGHVFKKKDLELSGHICRPPVAFLVRRLVHQHPVKTRVGNGVAELVEIHRLDDIAVDAQLVALADVAPLRR